MFFLLDFNIGSKRKIKESLNILVAEGKYLEETYPKHKKHSNTYLTNFIITFFYRWTKIAWEFKSNHFKEYQYSKCWRS